MKVEKAKMPTFTVGNEPGVRFQKRDTGQAFRPRHEAKSWGGPGSIGSQQSAIGFTLLELLVVLALLSLLSAVAFPSIGRGLAALNLRTSSNQIASTLRLARSKAIREQQLYWIRFDLDENEVELSSEDLRFQRSFELPKGIVIKQASLVGGRGKRDREDPHFFFSPNGMAQAFEVRIRNERGRELRVVHDSLLRSPRVEEVQPEGPVGASR